MLDNLITREQLKEMTSLPEIQKYFSHMNQRYNDEKYSFRCKNGYFEIYFFRESDVTPTIHIDWDKTEDEVYDDHTKMDIETLKNLILKFNVKGVHSIIEFLKLYELTREDFEYLKQRGLRG